MKKFAAIVCLICLTWGMAVFPVEAAATIGGTLHIDKPKPQPKPQPQPQPEPEPEANYPTIYINGVQLYTANPPMIINGRTLVPIAAIFNALQRSVNWDPVNRVITSGPIWLQIDNSNARVNDQTVSLDVPAQIIDSRTYVPVSFIATSLGKDINWDAENNRIDIKDASNNDLSLYVNSVDYGGDKIVAQATFYNDGDVQITKVNYVTVRIYLYRDDYSYETVDATFYDLPLNLKPGESIDYTLTFTNVPIYYGITTYDDMVVDGQYVYI
ncbi:MAG: copper amine oxidase N-terminal domain-containing protein [Syntrophomonadaceae bacterium]